MIASTQPHDDDTASVLVRASVESSSHDASSSTSDLDAEARRLLTLVQGISVQAVFDTVEWSPENQRAFLSANIAGPKL